LKFILECGLTQADLEADIMKSLVQLRAKTVTDEEFRILAQYLVSNYFTSNSMPERGIRMRRPRKILEGRIEKRLATYLLFSPSMADTSIR
jgi:hypothetical protein